MKINLLSLSIVTVLAGCQSPQHADTVHQPLSKKDLLRKKWSCNVKRESDLNITFAIEEDFASLTMRKVDLMQTKRLRSDFKMPDDISDVISVRFIKPGAQEQRLMKGYIPMRVCGDFFVRNYALSADSLSIFTNLTMKENNSLLKWKIVYINGVGDIITTYKGLQFSAL